MSIHLKYGGSTMGRTMQCPAWQRLSKDMPKGKTSPAAQLGTDLHTVLEEVMDDLNSDVMASDYVGKTVGQTKITDALIDDKILPAADALEDMMAALHIDDYGLEVMVKHPKYDSIGGTIDFIGASEQATVVADYKSGDGVLVDAKDNPQLLFYCALAMIDPETEDMFEEDRPINLVIIQPTNRREQVVDIWATTYDAVFEWWNNAMRSIAAAELPRGEPVAGKYCKFCPAHAVCPVKTGVAAMATRLDPASTELTSLNTAMGIVDEVEEWARAVRKLAHEQMDAGVKIEGWKVVNKRASRVWNDHDAAEKKLRKMRRIVNTECFETKLRTPPQIEKICKNKGIAFDKEFGTLVSAVSSGTTIAKTDDPRQEAAPVGALQALVDATS